MGSIGTAVVLLPAGFAIDRVGPRQMMVASWALGVVGAALILAASFGSSWQFAAAGIFVYGMSAFAIPAVSAYALATARVTDHPGGVQGLLGVIATAYPIGLIISPAVGGLITQRYGMQANLAVGVGMFVVSTLIVLLTRNVAPHPTSDDHRVDALLRNPEFLALTFFFALTWLVMLAGQLLVPNFLQEVRKVDVAIIGTLYSVMSISTVAFNLSIGRLGRRWAFPVLASAVWLALLGLWQFAALGGIVASFVAMGATYTVRALASAQLEPVIGPHERGMAFSAQEMLFALANALAAGSAGLLYKSSPSHDLPLIIGVVVLPVLVAAWLIIRRRPEKHEGTKERMDE
jgi:predicted MFS family arabinose efflux permease